MKLFQKLFKNKIKNDNIRRKYGLEQELRTSLKGEIDNGHLFFMMYTSEEDKLTNHITKNVIIDLFDKALSGDESVIEMLKSVTSTHELMEIIEKDRLMDTIQDCLPKEQKELPKFKKEDILDEKQDYNPNPANLYGTKKQFNVFDHMDGYGYNGAIGGDDM